MNGLSNHQDVEIGTRQIPASGFEASMLRYVITSAIRDAGLREVRMVLSGDRNTELFDGWFRAYCQPLVSDDEGILAQVNAPLVVGRIAVYERDGGMVVAWEFQDQSNDLPHSPDISLFKL